MAAAKHSKLGLAAFALAIAGFSILGFGFNSLLHYSHWHTMPALFVVMAYLVTFAFLLGWFSLHMPRTKKTYGVLALVLSGLTALALLVSVIRAALAMPNG